MIPNTKSLSTTLLAATACAASGIASSDASAAVLIASESTDFNDGTFGPFDNIDESGGGTEVRNIADSINRFGEGTANRIIELEDTGGNNTRLGNNTAANLPTLFTLAFDYWEPDNALSSRTAVRTGNGTDTGNTAIDFSLNNGSIGFTGSPSGTSSETYDLETPYRFTLIANYSGSSQDNGNGGTVADDTYDVFMTDLGTGVTIQVLDDATFRNNIAPQDFISFNTFNSDTQELFIDNVSVYDGAFVIPEPASLALLTLGGLMIAGRRRREA